MVGCEDGSVRLWDLRSGEEVAAWMAHHHPVLSVRFDSTKAVSGADDGAFVWGEWPSHESFSTDKESLNCFSIRSQKISFSVAVSQHKHDKTTE